MDDRCTDPFVMLSWHSVVLTPRGSRPSEKTTFESTYFFSGGACFSYVFSILIPSRQWHHPTLSVLLHVCLSLCAHARTSKRKASCTEQVSCSQGLPCLSFAERRKRGEVCRTFSSHRERTCYENISRGHTGTYCRFVNRSLRALVTP